MPDDDNDKARDDEPRGCTGGTLHLLRAYAFLLLDSAGTHMVKARERKPCIRLMRVALKAAKACILGKDLDNATRVLERAATYEDILDGAGHQSHDGETDVARRLQLEYFAVRTVLVRLFHLLHSVGALMLHD